MTQQQVRTVVLAPGDTAPDDEFWAKGEVQIIAPGTNSTAVAGQTLAGALSSAGVPLPRDDQTVRVNLEEVRDMSRIVQQGDRVTISNRVSGG